MMLLGLETATTVCAAALVDDAAVRAEAWIDERNVHAERLLLQIDRVLKQAAVALGDLSGIAVSIGPGSFTGLRIGLSVAKGLVYASGKPLVAVPTLQGLAHRVLAAAPAGTPEAILALLDARRDEVYAQLFDVREGTAVPAWDVRAMTVDDLVRAVDRADVLVTGDAMKKLNERLAQLPAAEQRRFRFAGTEISRCSAVSIAHVGLDLLRQGKTDDPAGLEPRYIKEFYLKSR